jgi:hypothetical protein
MPRAIFIFVGNLSLGDCCCAAPSSGLFLYSAEMDPMSATTVVPLGKQW